MWGEIFLILAVYLPCSIIVFGIMGVWIYYLEPAGSLLKAAAEVWLACLNDQPHMGVIVPSIIFGHCSHLGDCHILCFIIYPWPYVPGSQSPKATAVPDHFWHLSSCQMFSLCSYLGNLIGNLEMTVGEGWHWWDWWVCQISFVLSSQY